MTDPDVQRDLGELFAITESTERRLTSMEAKIDRLLAFEATAKGGWRTLLAVATFAGAVGAFFANLWPFWSQK